MSSLAEGRTPCDSKGRAALPKWGLRAALSVGWRGNTSATVTSFLVECYVRLMDFLFGFLFGRSTWLRPFCYNNTIVGKNPKKKGWYIQ